MNVRKLNTSIRKPTSVIGGKLMPDPSNNKFKVSLELPAWLILGIGFLASVSVTIGLRFELSLNGTANTKTQIESSSSTFSKP